MESGTNPQGQQNMPSPGLIELLGRAVTDDQFRDKLYSDQEGATQGYMLTDSDRQALANLPKEELDNQAKRFGSASETGLTIGIYIKGSF